MRLPKLPSLLDRKIYKTGQTRGADDDQIYQNRVGRNSTVLIPFSVLLRHSELIAQKYENDFIVLMRPTEYFENGRDQLLLKYGLTLGLNCLIFYELRDDWLKWNPIENGFSVPTSRKAPLGGQYVARIANTTASGDARINHGYTSTGLKGAGIRLYEYAPNVVINQCRVQLEALFWHAADAKEAMIAEGMSEHAIAERSKFICENASKAGLLDYAQLQEARTLNHNKELVCPLCLQRLSAKGFISRMSQASGRERHDLTVTEVSLFHIKELAYSVFNHRPYNLGWGHHHCNVVCKDTGIFDTIEWMKEVIRLNTVLPGE